MTQVPVLSRENDHLGGEGLSECRYIHSFGFDSRGSRCLACTRAFSCIK